MKLGIIKIVLFVILITAFTTSAGFAQHSHAMHSDHNKAEKENIKEMPLEKLPSGLADTNSHEHNNISDTSKSEHKNHHMKAHKKDHMGSNMNMSDHKNVKPENSGKVSIVREGEIDLQAIDENQDGKVFQDQMDWNVISDKAGECPVCGMTLKEITLEKAKENLIKNKFKVKEN